MNPAEAPEGGGTMGKPRRIDLSHYTRRDHYEYFRSMAYPYVGTTVNVDITRFLQGVKDREEPFFLAFLYRAVGAANQIPQLRQRLDAEGILEYAVCPSSNTVAREDGTYAYCALDCHMPFPQFLPYAQERQRQAKAGGSIQEEGDAQAFFFVSTLPWLSYAALIQPTPFPADSNPRLTWGRYFEQAGRTLMPVSLLCHHALVDGLHIAQFYAALEAQLEN